LRKEENENLKRKITPMKLKMKLENEKTKMKTPRKIKEKKQTCPKNLNFWKKWLEEEKLVPVKAEKSKILDGQGQKKAEETKLLQDNRVKKIVEKLEGKLTANPEEGRGNNLNNVRQEVEKVDKFQLLKLQKRKKKPSKVQKRKLKVSEKK
jgi:hypothetical protein